jgi:hypothetical protein
LAGVHEQPNLAFAGLGGWLSAWRGTRLAMDRHIYKEVLAIVRANPTLMQSHGDFFEWMRRLYVGSMTVAVRRLVDTHWKKPLSFVGLMDEIADHPEALPRDRFVRPYPAEMRRRGMADRDFDRFSGPGARHVSRAIIADHRRRLMRAQRRLRTYVNKHIAHSDRRPMRRMPTFQELDAVLDLLEELLKEYVLLLEGKGLTDVLPVWQYDWKQPFRVAWIQ